MEEMDLNEWNTISMMVIFFKVTYSQLTVLFSQNTKVEGCFPSYAWLVGGK